MHISLIESRTFTAEIPGRTIKDLEIESEWNGLTKLLHPASGLYLIVMREHGLIVDGSPSLMDSLLAPIVQSGFINVPGRTLPGGIVVAPFQVSQYMNCVDASGKAYASSTEKPRVKISYRDSIKACEAAGLPLLTGSQALAISLDIIEQDANWTGGKVGQGHVYRGLHKGSVYGAQLNSYEPTDPEERRWHVLSNGERIYDFAGHLWCWMQNDLPGNVDGLAGKIPADSPYLTAGAQYTRAQGMGYRSDGARDWSGYALIRGGGWYDGGNAGVFRLYYDSPDFESGYVGFRCTNP